MPRRLWPRKDAYDGDTRRVGVINRFIRRFPNGVTLPPLAGSQDTKAIQQWVVLVFWRGTA